ncbi:MAG TPA: PH domain-containing protein [Anaerolineaceae bacterium]|nr:PH domain-containing protein [Anaerolineaceae bacterium]
MNLPSQYPPPRRDGLIFQIGLSLILLAAGSYCMFQATIARIGGPFLIYLVLALLFFAPVPVLLYRAYSLIGATYVLERDGLRLHWGLRSEDIPLPEIEWVRLASDLPSLYVSQGRSRPKTIPLPLVHWPGALNGTRNVEGLGPIEFIASSQRGLILVATPRRIYAISPAQPDEFLKAFNRITELGSLSPLASRSVYPTFLLTRVWTDVLARVLLAADFFLALALLFWVILVIPTRPAISLGFTPGGLPGESGPVERLLLLPVLDGLAFLASFLAGLYFYRRPDQKLIAYFVWAGNLLAAVLLLAGVFFITLS